MDSKYKDFRFISIALESKMQTHSEPLSPRDKGRPLCCVCQSKNHVCKQREETKQRSPLCLCVSELQMRGASPHLVPAGRQCPDVSNHRCVDGKALCRELGGLIAEDEARGACFVPRLRVLMCLAGGAANQGHNLRWLGKSSVFKKKKHPAWIILGVPDLSVIGKGASPSAPKRSTFPVNMSRNNFPRHKGKKNTAAREQHATWEALNMEV